MTWDTSVFAKPNHRFPIQKPAGVWDDLLALPTLNTIAKHPSMATKNPCAVASEKWLGHDVTKPRPLLIRSYSSWFLPSHRVLWIRSNSIDVVMAMALTVAIISHHESPLTTNQH